MNAKNNLNLKNYISRILAGVSALALIQVGSFATAATETKTESKAEVKIGFVDMQRAIQSVSEGKKAKDALEKEVKDKQKELKAKEDDLKKMNEDLEKKSALLSDEVKAKKQQTLQEEMMKYREMVGKSQFDLQKRERDLTMPIVKKLQEVVDGIAAKEDFTMILGAEQGVLWAKKEIDLTDRVVEEFEKKSGGKSDKKDKKDKK